MHTSRPTFASPRTILRAGWASILIGGFLLTVALWRAGEWSYFVLTSTRAEGIVTGSRSGLKATTTALVTYRAGEQDYQAEAFAGWRKSDWFGPSYDVGSALTVRYPADRPHAGRVIAFWEGWPLTAWFFTGGAMGLFLGMCFVGSVLAEQRRYDAALERAVRESMRPR